MRSSTSVSATVFTVRASAVNLADIPRCVTCVLFWVQTFDCVYFQRSCDVTNLERVNLLQKQVAVTLLDPRNMSDLNCITRDQDDQAGRSCEVCSFVVIDEVKNSDAPSTDVNSSIEDVNDFLVMASAAAVVNSLDLSSAEINDREIKI